MDTTKLVYKEITHSILNGLRVRSSAIFFRHLQLGSHHLAWCSIHFYYRGHLLTECYLYSEGGWYL